MANTTATAGIIVEAATANPEVARHLGPQYNHPEIHTSVFYPLLDEDGLFGWKPAKPPFQVIPAMDWKYGTTSPTPITLEYKRVTQG
jgi:hypothetical protein